MAKAIFDPAAVLPDDLRDWLEERVGPLVRFELDPQRPQPDPPRPEPAGAPQSKSGPESQERQGNAPPVSVGNGAFGSLSDLERQPAGSGGRGPAAPAMSAELVRTPPEAVSGLGGCDALPEAVEAPPGPPVAPQASIHPEPAAGDLSAELRAVQVLQQRRRLAALAERLQDSKPKRVHGVRQLDWDAWEVAARAAAELPSAEWEAWRATIGTAAAGWPPRPPAPPPAVEAHR